MNTQHPLLTALPVALAVIGSAAGGLAEDDHIRLHPKGQRLDGDRQGPYANLPGDTLVATTYGTWIEGRQPFIVSIATSSLSVFARALTMARSLTPMARNLTKLCGCNIRSA